MLDKRRVLFIRIMMVFLGRAGPTERATRTVRAVNPFTAVAVLWGAFVWIRNRPRLQLLVLATKRLSQEGRDETAPNVCIRFFQVVSYVCIVACIGDHLGRL